jgi:hypothetical protein
MAIVTYNIDIAKEAKAAFRTHYGWKVRQVVTDYFREIVTCPDIGSRL